MESSSIASQENSEGTSDHVSIQNDEIGFFTPANLSDGLFEFETEHLKRDDEDHVIIHAQHKELDWCKAGVRIISRPDQSHEIQSSFGIDRIGYALEEDFEPQRDTVTAISDVIDAHFPSIGAANVLHEHLETSFSRIRQCWAENETRNFSINRFSIYKDYKQILVLAAPTTALGSNEIAGVQHNYNETEFESYSNVSHKNLKRLQPITQKLLKDNSQFSGHEKLQLLSGEVAEKFLEAQKVFNEIRLRPGYRKSRSFGFSDTDTTAWQSRTYDYGWEGDVRYLDESSFSLSCDSNDRHHLNISSHIAAKKLNLKSDWRQRDNPFYICGGVGAKDRFPSVVDLDLSFSTLFERMIALDPVWPKWVYKECNVPFDAKHITLKNLSVPPRHQPVIAMMLNKSYDKQKKLTERFVARQEKKKAAKVNAISERPRELPDGTVFGKIETGGLKAWDRIDCPFNIRIYAALTVNEKSAKRHLRALVPLCGAMNPRPCTPKQIARLTPYTKVDALRLFPDPFLGDEKRDLLEAAFRVTFELTDTTENPLLDGSATISLIDTDKQGMNVRWTKFDDKCGYSLMSFSVIETEEPRSYDGQWEQTGVGIGVLTTPKGRQVYLRPSLIEKNNHLPQCELDWLKIGINQALHFEPSRAEEIVRILEDEWENQSEILNKATKKAVGKEK